MTISALTQKVKNMNQKVLKSNLRQLINQKYEGKGWRDEVAERLQMNKNTFNGIINQANASKVSMETLLFIVEGLRLNINDVLANNKVIKSSQGRYGSEDVKWNKETKTQFLIDYQTKDIDYVVNKYNLTPGTAKTYSIQFKKTIKIL